MSLCLRRMHPPHRHPSPHSLHPVAGRAGCGWSARRAARTSPAFADTTSATAAAGRGTSGAATGADERSRRQVTCPNGLISHVWAGFSSPVMCAAQASAGDGCGCAHEPLRGARHTFEVAAARMEGGGGMLHRRQCVHSTTARCTDTIAFACCAAQRKRCQHMYNHHSSPPLPAPHCHFTLAVTHMRPHAHAVPPRHAHASLGGHHCWHACTHARLHACEYVCFWQSLLNPDALLHAVCPRAMCVNSCQLRRLRPCAWLGYVQRVPTGSSNACHLTKLALTIACDRTQSYCWLTPFASAGSWRAVDGKRGTGHCWVISCAYAHLSDCCPARLQANARPAKCCIVSLHLPYSTYTPLFCTHMSCFTHLFMNPVAGMRQR